MTTITVDGHSWSGRRTVASLLAKAQKCELISKHELVPLLERRGIDSELFLERIETKTSLSRRIGDFVAQGMILTSLTSHGYESGLHSFPINFSTNNEATEYHKTLIGTLPLTPEKIKLLLDSLILESIGTDPTVVLGCGAQAILQDDPDVLKIFLTAPQEIRVARAKLQMAATTKSALNCINQLDRDRESFYKQTFNFSWDDPSNYDLYLDSGTLTYGNVVESIVNAEFDAELNYNQRLTTNLN